MALRASISRPLLAAARNATKRTPPSATPASASVPLHHHCRRLAFACPRSLGVLGGAMSLLPLHSVVAAARLNSHLPVNARACCGLSKGTFLRTCKDP